LQERPERRATYRTVIRLISQRIGAGVAQTQVSAW